MCKRSISYTRSLYSGNEIVNWSVTEIRNVTGSTEKIEREKQLFLSKTKQTASDEVINRADKWRFFESLEL